MKRGKNENRANKNNKLIYDKENRKQKPLPQPKDYEEIEY